MKLNTKAIAGLLCSALLASAGVQVFAAQPENQPGFQKNHPRQTEVLKRTDRERRRINKDYKAGKITKAQRDQMLSQVKDVRKEDRADAKANGGGITKDQQKVMNQQENAINKEIKSDATQAVPATPQ